MVTTCHRGANLLVKVPKNQIWISHVIKNLVQVRYLIGLSERDIPYRTYEEGQEFTASFVDLLTGLTKRSSFFLYALSISTHSHDMQNPPSSNNPHPRHIYHLPPIFHSPYFPIQKACHSHSYILRIRFESIATV